MLSHSSCTIILILLTVISSILSHQRGVTSFIRPSRKVSIITESLLRIVGISHRIHTVGYRKLAGKARRVCAGGVRICLAFDFHEVWSLDQLLLIIAQVRIGALSL